MILFYVMFLFLWATTDQCGRSLALFGFLNLRYRHLAALFGRRIIRHKAATCSVHMHVLTASIRALRDSILLGPRGHLARQPPYFKLKRKAIPVTGRGGP
jgi:hypothetical protein